MLTGMADTEHEEMTMTNQTATTGRALPKLPAGAAAVLPTVWLTFIVTVLLALAFSFWNVWDLNKLLGVEHHVAPLVGPAVDLTAIGLLVVVPWFVLAGIAPEQLKAANRLMRLAGFLTLALNSGPSAIAGWVGMDPRAWGRALVEAIVPTLLIAWSHVGPGLIALFVEVRERHTERVAEALREADRRASVESSTRQAEIDAAVAEATSVVAVQWESERAEIAAQQASTEAALEASTEALRRAEEALAEARRSRPRTAGKTSGQRHPKHSTDDAVKVPRKTAAELLDERVEVAKDALPTWQLETPSGPEIASALGLKSAGVISEIRKRLDADRLALAANKESA